MRRTEIDFGPGNDPVRRAHAYVAYKSRDVPGEHTDVHIGPPAPVVTIRPFRSLLLAVQNVILPPSEFDVPTAVPSSAEGRLTPTISGSSSQMDDADADDTQL